MTERRFRELGELLFQKIEQSAIRQKQIDDMVSKNTPLWAAARRPQQDWF